MMRKHRYWIAALAVLIVISAGLWITLLDRRCRADGGTFNWLAAGCDGSARPIILQGDIHRV